MGLLHLPESSRIWIFTANRKFTDYESTMLAAELDIFVSSWKAHGNALSAGFDICYGCQIIIGVDENAEVPSGCSIDKAFRLLQNFGTNHDLDFFQRTAIVKVEGEVSKLFSRDAALGAVDSGELKPGDKVVNTLIQQLSEWKSRALIPFEDSWLGKTRYAH